MIGGLLSSMVDLWIGIRLVNYLTLMYGSGGSVDSPMPEYPSCAMQPLYSMGYTSLVLGCGSSSSSKLYFGQAIQK